MARPRSLLLLVLAATLATVGPGRATTITVDTTVDDTTVNGNCTLREAVIAANTNAAVDGCGAGSGADLIVVSSGNYVLTLTGAGEDAAATGDLDITDNMEILGAGAGSTIVDGNQADRVFDISPLGGAPLVKLTALTVTHGSVQTGPREGGGVRNATRLVIEDCNISNNTAGNDLSAQTVQGGGLSNTGRVTIENSTISGNHAVAFGSNPSASGGGIYSMGTISITDSTISGNATQSLAPLGSLSGAGIWAGGPSTTIVGSTIRGNGSPAGPPPFSVSEGAISIAGGAASIYNSTISGNSTRFASGISAAGLVDVVNCTVTSNAAGGIGVAQLATVNLRNSTVSHNGRDFIGNGGIGVADHSSVVRLQNTIIANNFLPNCAAFSYGGPITTVSDAYNLSDDNSCGLSGTDLVGVDPILGPLQENGGPTETRGLLQGSPALEAGSPDPPGSGGTACEATDQRGVARPQAARCDIGAFEGLILPNLDHYKCYAAKDLKQPKFTRQVVTLEDQFGLDSQVPVLRPVLLCNPVDKNGEGIINPTDHLVCYRIEPRRNEQTVQVGNQFGTLRLKTIKSKLLCVPASKTVTP